MLRRILIAFLILLATLVLYIAGDILYRYYFPFYKTGYNLMEAVTSLNSKTKKQLEENEGILREMGQTLGWLYNRPTDSITYRRIYQKAKILHTSASALTTILDNTIVWNLNGDKFLEETGPDGNRKERDIFSDQVPVTDEYAKGIKQALISFLAQLPETFHSTQGHNRYKRLRQLTNLTDSEFYNQFFKEKEAYLLLGELAVIKSALVGLETEHLQNLIKQGHQLLWYPESTSHLYVPYSPDAPTATKAGDTATFTIRLAAPIKFNQKQDFIFEFPGGKIDSIKQNAVAYVSFSPESSNQSSGNYALTEYKLPATFRFKAARNLEQDTTFKTDLRIVMKGIKQ